MTADERRERDEQEHYEHIREQLADWRPVTEAQVEFLDRTLPAQRLAS